MLVPAHLFGQAFSRVGDEVSDTGGKDGDGDIRDRLPVEGG